MAAPSAPILSSFTGADENPLSEGGNWTSGSAVAASGLRRVSNAVQRVSGAGSFSREGSTWNKTTFLGSGEVVATVATAQDGEVNLYLANPATKNGYVMLVQFGPSYVPSFVCDITLVNAGVPVGTPLSTDWTSPVVASGDRVALQIDGNDLVGWHFTGGAWIERLRVTDTTYREVFSPQIDIAGQTTAGPIIDDFGAAAAVWVPEHKPLLMGLGRHWRPRILNQQQMPPVVSLLTPVSSSLDLFIDTTQGLTATAVDPFDVQQTLAGATALFPLEELQGIAATATSPVLMSGAVGAVAAFALDMVQQAAQTGLFPLDIAQGVGATTTSPVVMSGGVAATSAAAIEALQQIVQTGSSTIDDLQQALQTQQAPLEATGGITQTGSGPLDAGGGVAAASAFVIDMLKGVTQTGQMPVDMAALLAQAAAFALETQQAAAATGQVPVEVAQGLAQTAQEIIEAAKGVTSTATAPLDEVGLAAVSATGIFPLDLVQAVTQTGISSADTIQPVTTTGTSAIQTVQQASALAGLIVDAQQGLLRLVVLPASMLGGLAALAAMPIEEGQPAIIARPGSVTLTDAGGPILVLTDSMAGVLVVAELPAGSITTVEASVGSLTVTEPLAGAVTLTDGV